MPKNKDDERARGEYLPKIKALTDGRTVSENAKRIYDFLKPYQYDTSGWLLYDAAKGILGADVYDEFPAEDNMGYFENLDGYGLLNRLEIAKFADKEYEQLPGGYEKPAAHTLDENSREYREYQNKLYIAVIESIAAELADKQPYLLEGFWNRLSHIESILEKGFSTRDDLNKKIESEARRVFYSASSDDLSGFRSEAEIKHRIRNGLRSIFMSDETVQALISKDNVLDDAYRFYLEEGKDDQVFLSVFDYLEKEEHDYLAERMFDRVKLEYEDYVDEVKKMPPEKIIDEARKLTMMYDLRAGLDPETSDFSTDRLKALMSFASPLRSLYDDRQRCGTDDIKDVIAETADERAAENEAADFDIDRGLFGSDEEEVEDGQEP
jgi:hypothetical protein